MTAKKSMIRPIIEKLNLEADEVDPTIERTGEFNTVLSFRAASLVYLSFNSVKLDENLINFPAKYGVSYRFSRHNNFSRSMTPILSPQFGWK